ncbi:MAG TPA: hypothetical protein VLQ89_00490 [Candidatus Binatia bacterium]|nr:hypothetical protein [Candidatus Binatia bacterium]
MTFKKIFAIWMAITAVSGAAFYLLKTMFAKHPLWPWAVPYLYIGMLILFVLYLLSLKGDKK